MKDQDDLISELNKKSVHKDQEIAHMSQDYAEFQAVKKSFTYRFLTFHCSLTTWFVQRWRDLGEGWKLLREQGLRTFLSRLTWYVRGRRTIADISTGPLSLNQQYDLWLQQRALTQSDRLRIQQECENFSYQPVVSILVPVYNVEPKWLDRCLQSVVNQLL